MPTSRDVARRAGVSQSTVSYVLSGARPISEATRRRVQAAIEELGFEPHGPARALISRRTHLIAVIVPFGTSPNPSGLLPFIEAIANGVREHDYDVLLVTVDEGPSALTRLARRSLCDAIVLMQIEAADPRVPLAASLGIPVVLLGVPEDPAGLPCVDVDFESAARLAVQELIAARCDRIALLSYPAVVVERDIGFVRRLEDAARATARAAGVPLDIIRHAQPTRQGARDAVGRALAGRGERPGLALVNSVAVQPVLDALDEQGRALGDDVPLVALCSDAIAESALPAVTNVSLEAPEVSRRAVQLVFRLLGGDEIASSGVELVPPRLTRRATTPVG